MHMHPLARLMASVLLAGCATHGVAPAIAADVPANRYYWTPPSGETYRVKVSRDLGKMGSLCLAKISIDGTVAAELSNGESAIFTVPAGRHVLSGSPSLTTSLCQKFYSYPQMRTEIGIEGQPGEVKVYRYGFTGSGIPVLSPSSL